ncbi:uncharacterized protein LOC123517952 [Portunus trituberculatus]|uniref:uncharacterized protein LOC123517952 n=1 Tax=Portunus trituberculatus TaxID=210409 RepID=UPI001E1CF873|nr:uncharacterized protein LOC123517952 [Portunus trituberculatus]XP_045134366.1 uncharacterized protein LOC123517952 [Portunus trituberculatus]XP_045134368.1 uncharacterized protein LOC123517952 [Portunus trituberculatus]
MGFKRVSPVVRVGGRGWLRLDARHAALTAALCSTTTSVVVAALCGWQLVVNGRHPHHFQDVYYGVQIAYLATLCTHLALIFLSCFLIVGIYQERAGLVSPWVLATITFMALEAVCCVYSNVLRDHINKRFDTICKVEMSFLVARLLINILNLCGVLKFYRNLRAGYTYRDPEAIEL